jgi:hypothetical protein
METAEAAMDSLPPEAQITSIIPLMPNELFYKRQRLAAKI